ncbi:MAG TPA: hypothetical protein PLW65_03635 [Pseudomonadota bacterium]|nr:hypothetical protein [Pseudomonadota bacterium]
MVKRFKRQIWQVAIDCPQRGLQLKVVDRHGQERADAGTLVMFDEDLQLALGLPDVDFSEDDAVQAAGLAPAQPEPAPLPEASFWTYRGTYRVPRSRLLAAMLLSREDEDKGGLPATHEETSRSAVLALTAVFHSVRPAHLLGTSDLVSLAVAERRSARVAGTILMSIGLVSTLGGAALFFSGQAGSLGPPCPFPTRSDKLDICISGNDWGKFLGAVSMGFGGAELLTGAILLIVDAATPYPPETSQANPLLSNAPRLSRFQLVPAVGPNSGGLTLSGRF